MLVVSGLQFYCHIVYCRCHLQLVLIDQCCAVLMKVFIGHAESISSVVFMPDSKSLVSFGEAIFVWDFLASESGNFVPHAAE